MSHFTVALMVRGVEDITNRADVGERVAALLSPYDEEIQVDEYEEKCYKTSLKI